VTGVRTAALAALSVLVPLVVWVAGAYAADPIGADRYVALVRSAVMALWIGMGAMAVLAAPAMAAERSAGACAAAIAALPALVVPYLALTWLTGAVSVESLARGLVALGAWTGVAVAIAAGARRLPPSLATTCRAAIQVAMLALLAASWHTWTDWIGP
jgi:hypothetical protein